MYFDEFILTILFRNAKLSVKKKKKTFSKILGQAEEGKQTFSLSFF